MVEGDGRADRVGARGVLAPPRTLREAHLIGGTGPDASVSLDPQQPPLLVGNDDEMLGLLCGLRKPFTEERHGCA